MASVPLCIALAILAQSATSRLTRHVETTVRLAGAAAVLALVGLSLGAQTRQRQHWIEGQARAYQTLVTQAPLLCGELPARSQIYLAADPRLWDYFGGFSSMAFNLLYEDVLVAPFPPDHEQLTPQPGAAVCLIQYSESAGEYVRVGPRSAGQPTTPGR